MALQVGTGLSLDKDPGLAAKEAARQAGKNLKKIDLAIVFSSIGLASDNLTKAVSYYLEDVPIIGASGAAIITNQGIFKQGVAIMALDLPENVHINTAYVNQIKSKTALEAGRELGAKLFYGFDYPRRDLSLIFSDGLIDDGSKLLYGIQERLGKSFPLIGASASDNLRFAKTYVYANKEAFSDSACGTLWSGRLSFGLGIKHGWKPLGKPHYVTKSHGNLVYQIDNVRATKIYEEYFACNIPELRKKMKYISVLYPIGIYLAGEEEYLLRNIRSIEDDGSLVFQGDVPETCLVRLMIGTKESCFAATKQAVEEAKKGLFGPLTDSKKIKESNYFLLVFDSVSRYTLLRRHAGKELEIIQEGFDKNAPLIGLYTYGEQAPLKAISYQGQTYFHNQTIAILAAGETLR